MSTKTHNVPSAIKYGLHISYPLVAKGLIANQPRIKTAKSKVELDGYAVIPLSREEPQTIQLDTQVQTAFQTHAKIEITPHETYLVPITQEQATLNISVKDTCAHIHILPVHATTVNVNITATHSVITLSIEQTQDKACAVILTESIDDAAICKLMTGSSTCVCATKTQSQGQSITLNVMNNPNQEAQFIQLHTATKDQKLDVQTTAIHTTHNTKSNSVIKGVVDGNAQALNKSLIRIEENAEKSQGFEQQDMIILSPNARADAIPDLEIHNHDVSCSHGSTISRIDEAKLFYLQSRGLSLDDAKDIVITAFLASALNDHPQTHRLITFLRP